MVELSQKENGNEDSYSKAIGELGRWQIFVFMVTAFPIKLVLPSIQFGIIFMAPKTSFMCIERLNATDLTVNGSCYSDCVKYEYYSEFDTSIISQWDLICDRAWLANLPQTILMFGVLVGSIVFGFISDRYGRRMTLIFGGTMETCMSFIMPFSPNYWCLIVVRFLLGAATGGTMMTSFVLLMEIFGPTKRNILGSVYMLPVALGQLLIAVIAYYFRTWRGFSVAMAIPTLAYLTYYFCLPESPKWLISVGKLDEATNIMETAAKWNKLPTENIKTIVENIAHEATNSKKDVRKATLLDLVWSPNLRWKNFNSCVMWFTSGICFYGTAQYFGQTTPNVFLAVGIQGILQVPGFLIGGYLSGRFGRKAAIIGLSVLNSICNALLVLPEDYNYVKLAAGIVSVSTGGATFCLLYLYTTELFPTVARNMAMGSSSTVNRVGSMLAPFISGLRTTAIWIPPVVFTITPLLGILACCFLPETKGKKLEDHLDEN